MGNRAKRVGLLVVPLLCITLLAFAGNDKAKSDDQAEVSDWVGSMLQKVVEATNEQVGNEKGDVPVAVAGLRGEEQKNEPMEPYWKGVLTRRSVDYQAFHEVEEAMQKGNYERAIGLIASFKKEYEKSRLLPEVQFTLGLAYAGIGKNQQAVTAFEDLINRYPEHQLVPPSREGISRLNKA